MAAIARSTASDINNCSVATRVVVVPQPVNVASATTNSPLNFHPTRIDLRRHGKQSETLSRFLDWKLEFIAENNEAEYREQNRKAANYTKVGQTKEGESVERAKSEKNHPCLRSSPQLLN